MSDLRQRFEKWITSAPFEKSVERFPDDQTRVSWPGNYRDINVELAWQAWQEAARQSAWKGDPVYRVPSACRDDRNTCRVFHRDIEGRVVAEFFGPNAQAMAERFCELFGEPSGSKR